MIRIESDGTPEGTRVLTEQGEDIGKAVRAVRWQLDADTCATAIVELDVIEAPYLSGEVEWVGLEDVPDAALRAELARREMERRERAAR